MELERLELVETPALEGIASSSASSSSNCEAGRQGLQNIDITPHQAWS